LRVYRLIQTLVSVAAVLGAAVTVGWLWHGALRGSTDAAAAPGAMTLQQRKLRQHLLRLRSDEPRLRLAAANALAAMSRSACICQAVPALIDTLKDPDPDVRAAAAEALGEIGDVRAVDALQEILSEGHPATAPAAARALAAIRASNGIHAAPEAGGGE